MNKHTLIQKIKSISELTHEEQAELINLVNNTKKYGLVWEDKFEQIEEDLLTNLPVLKEVKDRLLGANLWRKSNAKKICLPQLKWIVPMKRKHFQIIFLLKETIFMH
jgi:hypothetical protein